MFLLLASLSAALGGPRGGESGRARDLPRSAAPALQLPTPEGPRPLDLSAALSRVDWLAWAAPQEELDRWIEQELSPQGSFAASLRADAADTLAELRGAPIYAVEAEVLQMRSGGQERVMLQLRQALVYTNPAQVPLEGIALRVFANGQDAHHNRSIVQGVWVDNQPARFSVDATILSVELPESLPPGASARILLHVLQDVPPFDPRAPSGGPRAR